MKASELREIKTIELAYSEIDGGLSIRPEIVAQRLNELLLCLQNLEDSIDELIQHG